MKTGGKQGTLPSHPVNIKTGPSKDGPPHGTRGNPVGHKGGEGGNHGC